MLWLVVVGGSIQDPRFRLSLYWLRTLAYDSTGCNVLPILIFEASTPNGNAKSGIELLGGLTNKF